MDAIVQTMHAARQPPIILFNRKLTRRIAGGARAVFDRANLYAEENHDVYIVFMEFTDDRNKALETLRREGILHPRVRILRFWREGVPVAAYAAAAACPCQTPPPLPTGPDVRVEATRRSGRIVAVSIFAGAVMREQRMVYGSGNLRLRELFDSEGRLTERWRHDIDGLPVTIDYFDAASGAVTRRDYLALGRAVWLKASLVEGEGSGPASTPISPPPSTQSLAGAVADWLDRRFAKYAEIVCMADGENVSQHVIRAMRHPGLRAVSVLHNCHTVEPYDAAAPTKPNWEAFLKPTDRPVLTVCLTGQQKEDLLARYSYLRISVAHHFAPLTRPVAVERDPKRLVFVGRLSRQKRLDHLIAAFSRVVEAIPDARLDIWGGGDERETLERLVADAALEDSIRFRGFTSRPEEAFASAAATVMTSLYEGFPLTLLEAMSVGTPFIAYDANYGPAEVIRDGIDGFVTPYGDVDALAARLIEVLKDRALQQRLQTNAREVASRFSAERYRRCWLDVLETARSGIPVAAAAE